MERQKKVYVDVFVMTSADGTMFPRKILWADGRVFKIDRIVDVRPCRAARVGSMGDRYTIYVHGQPRYLYYEHADEYADVRPGRWFLEA